MNVVCLLPVPNVTRYQLRLAALRRHGITARVLAFDRPGNPGKPLTYSYQSLGRITHGRYVTRSILLGRALPLVREVCSGADVVYAFSLDLLAVAWLATRCQRRAPRFVYEVADIRAILLGESLRSRAMRAVERNLLRQSSLLVVTSEAFISGYFRGVQRVFQLPYQLIENKPDLSSVAPNTPKAREPRRPAGTLTIGYFGLIRCRWSWLTLQRIAARGEGRIRVYVRGAPLGIPDFEPELAACPWIEYGGPYLSPDQLPELYERVDLCWIAQRVSTNSSASWNRTHRFYEACAFGKAMIAQRGTQDGGVVARQGLGICIDLADPVRAAGEVLAIEASDVAEWERNVGDLPQRVYRDCGEHDLLARSIIEIGRTREHRGQAPGFFAST